MKEHPVCSIDIYDLNIFLISKTKCESKSAFISNFKNILLTSISEVHSIHMIIHAHLHDHKGQ